MKKLQAIKTAALFVGSVVGAGFATGQEVRLFFGGDGVASLAVASLFMAVCAYAFLEIGARRRAFHPQLLLATDGVVALSSFAVYAAMIAAAEEVLFRLTGASWFSLPLALAVTILAGERISWVSALNLVAVPLMAAVIVVVGLRSPAVLSGGFHPIRAFAYGGMNLLFSGALMMREGERLAPRERLAASVAAGAVIFLMLAFMHRCVSGEGTTEMPFLAAATREGLGTFASLALLLAIVTTMVGCAYLLAQKTTALTHDGTFACSLTTLAGYLTSTVGFAPLVTYAYPVVSFLGLALTLVALALAFLPSVVKSLGRKARFWKKKV